MAKKGYIEGFVTYKVSLTVEIPLAGDAIIQINRIGNPISIVCE